MQVSKRELKPDEFAYNCRSEQMFHWAFAAVHSIFIQTCGQLGQVAEKSSFVTSEA